MKINVNTPKGIKYHGEIIEGRFYRKVTWIKDRMRIFDAWSLNPDIVSVLERNDVKQLIYLSDNGNYRISLENALKHGFKRSFSGGETLYVPIKFWEKEEEQKLL